MSHDLIISGGRVIDGTGADAVRNPVRTMGSPLRLLVTAV